MPRTLPLLVFLSAVLSGPGLTSRCEAVEPWETQSYSEVPDSSALRRMAPVTAPPRPVAAQRPNAWPSSAPAPTGTSGEAFASDAGVPATSLPARGGQPYPMTNYPLTAPPAAPAPAPVTVGIPEAQIDTGPSVVAELKLCEEAQPVATVGGEWILLAEVYDSVSGLLLINYPNEIAKFTPEQLEQTRQGAVPKALEQMIETRLIYLDAKRHLPAENLPKIEEKVNEFFESQWVTRALERTQAGSRQELERKLQALGSSLPRQRKLYVEQALAARWMEDEAADHSVVSRDELLAYYEEHHKDYEHIEQVRWQQLMVRFSDYPSRQEAWAALAAMGNQILGGTAFGEVAKASSKGPTAKDGGLRPWTSRGSLVSQVLDEAIFSLPVGQLSQILEDKQGLHIVQVVERKGAGRTPFEEVQHDIKKSLLKQREEKKRQEYVAKLRKEIPVWTVFEKREGNPLTQRPATSPQR